MSSVSGGGTSPQISYAQQAQKTAKKLDAKQDAQADTTAESLQDNPQTNLAAKFAASKKNSLETRKASSTDKKDGAGKKEKTDKTQKAESKSPLTQVEEKIKEFEDGNPELAGDSGHSLEMLLDLVLCIENWFSLEA